jgi:proteic killer suppression protein
MELRDARSHEDFKRQGLEKQMRNVPGVCAEESHVLDTYSSETNESSTEVMKSPGFHDEPFEGFRRGQRSARMNRAYRLIYQIIDASRSH